MLEYLVETVRGRVADQRRAKSRLLEDSAAANPGKEPWDQPQGSGIVVGYGRSPRGAEVPIEAPLDECGHMGVIGSTGSGKTRLVLHMRRERLRRHRGSGVLDFKGELFALDNRCFGAVAALLSPDQLAQFVESYAVVNLFSEDALPPSNVCLFPDGAEPEVEANETATCLEALFPGGFTFGQDNLAYHILLLLGEHRLSLVEAPLLFDDELTLHALVSSSRHERMKQFFFGTFRELPPVTKDALRTRLESLTRSENTMLALGADSMLPLKEILDRGLPFSMNLGKGPRVPEEQAETMAALYFGKLMRAAYSPSPTRRSYQVFADEFINVLGQPSMSRRFRSALTTFRSYKIYLALVMHNFAQTDVAMRETLLGNSDCISLFRTSTRNADFLGDFVDTRDAAMLGDPWAAFASARTRRALVMERLQRMPKKFCWWYDRRKAHRAVLMRVADVVEPHKTLGWSESRLDDFIKEHGIDRGGFALPRSVLRAQIAARAERLRHLVNPPIRVAPAPPPRASRRTGAGSNKRRPMLG